jgi:hypothetical protein
LVQARDARLVNKRARIFILSRDNSAMWLDEPAAPMVRVVREVE